MEAKLNKLQAESHRLSSVHKPEFFRLSDKADAERFEKLLEANKRFHVFDQLQGQLEELLKLRNPHTKFNKEELTAVAKSYLGSTPPYAYGVWVYYPWSSRLVHLLDEEEFVEVRTSRNQYKITPEEKKILAGKKVGVIGLSVGQSVAVTMAMERIFGEIRLTDFDILELSNYNRIRTGLHNLGISKVVSVAREISEIDPFLKVICYTDGATETNIDDFFLKEGKLDLVLEECDGLSIKILARQKAKELQVPVVMETSDRGMVDVERFDLEPDRPLLHGLIEHLDINKVKEAKTNEEKIPFILPMVGIDKISARLKASMMEVEQTLTTWPQLASAVTIGGGLATDVSRRILLDQFRSSGRYYVDVEEQIADAGKGHVTHEGEEAYHSYKEIEKADMLAAWKSVTLPKQNFLKLSQSVIEELIHSAIQAPSGGNCQPWKWLYKEGRLMLFFDKARSKSFLDYNDIASYFSLGAAIENLTLKAHEKGFDVCSHYFPIPGDEQCVALIQFGEKGTCEAAGSHKHDPLVSSIFTRCTNRTITARAEISADLLSELKALVEEEPGFSLQISTNVTDLDTLGQIAGAADRLRFLHPQTHYDLYYNEVRWNEKENNETRDGVDIATIPFTSSELMGFKLAKDEQAIAHLRKWNLGTAFESISKNSVETASAMAFLTYNGCTRVDQVKAGRMMQRMWLWTDSKELAVHPFMVPLMFFAHLERGGADELSESMISELRVLRKKFLDVFRGGKDICEVGLFKIFKAPRPSVISLRRPVSAVAEFS